MSRIVKIAIVGRPNVGKSLLFNCFVKKPQAIVAEEEGVTRDRIYGRGDFFGRPFEVIDTGGMLSNEANYGKEIDQQAEIAVEEADAIILVVDGTVGPLALDLEVAKRLRRSKKPLFLAVNKIDNAGMMHHLIDFSCLGIQPMIAISCIHRFQIAELLEEVFKKVPEYPPSEESLFPRVCIIGRTNVGKSALLNSFFGESRAIVSPNHGTTRDSLDTNITFQGKTYTIIDTAGIRKRHKERHVIEKFAFLRTESALERSDVAILLTDCQSGVTAEEKRMVRLIEEQGKGCILALNKWDLAKGFRMEHALMGVNEEVSFLKECPKICVSAKTGRNVEKLFPLIDTVLSSLDMRISTGSLNKALMSWMQKYHPPMIKGRRLRIYYMAQVDTHPPHFVLFVNKPDLMDDSYKRYLINQLRDTFSFQGVPFLFTLKGKIDKKRDHTPSPHKDHDLRHVIEAQEEDECEEFE